jgi:RHS repeat-associated protein
LATPPNHTPQNLTPYADVNSGTPQATTRHSELFFKPVAVNNATAAQTAAITVTGVKNNVGSGGEDAVTQTTKTAFLAQTPEAFTADSDGNLTADARWAYTWDGENRLSAMETSPAAATAGVAKLKLEFSYDGQGRRVSKKVSNWTGSAWTLASQTLFLYDGWNMVAELNALSSNAAVRTYVWGLDGSGSFQGAGGVGGLIGVTDSTGSRCATYDGNGNVSGLVDMATGAKSATYDYNAFGETIIADGPMQDAFPFRFSTKYQDAETGFYNYGYRIYQPSTGRWLSKDPLEEEGGVNLYGFVSNNAVDAIDPLGQNGYTQGLLWLLGLGKDKHYGPGDFSTGEMQRSRVARIIRDKVRDELRQYCKSGGTGSKKIPIDVGLNKISPYAYPILFGVDLLTNSTAAFVGSFTTGEIIASSIDCCKCEAELHWHAINVSGTESATHKPPRAGKYGDALLKDDILGPNGPMHTTTQTYDWDESFSYGPCK